LCSSGEMNSESTKTGLGAVEVMERAARTADPGFGDDPLDLYNPKYLNVQPHLNRKIQHERIIF
jgi:hypothetical protein